MPGKVRDEITYPFPNSNVGLNYLSIHKLQRGIKLLIHSQTPTVAPLKFGNA